MSKVVIFLLSLVILINIGNCKNATIFKDKFHASTVENDESPNVLIHHPGNYHCSGVLIAHNYVLTSATCLLSDGNLNSSNNNNIINNYKILLSNDALKKNSKSKFYNTTAIFINDKFLNTHQNHYWLNENYSNIAILKFNKNVINNVQKFASLSGDDRIIGDNITVFQYKKLSANNKNKTDLKLWKINTFILKVLVGYCKEMPQYRGYYTDILCAKYFGTGNFNINCGEPVYNNKMEVVGITQGTFKSSNDTIEFTTVSQHKDWIEKIILSNISDSIPW